MKSKDLQIRVVLFALSFVALVIGFRAMLFEHLPGVFSAPQEDLSFAWYVPLFSLYVLWTERDAVRRAVGAPSLAPLLGIVPCLALGLLGARGLQVRFELLAFVGLLIFIPWAFFGRRLADRVAFPALFLLFCMPLATYLSLITVHLRLLVSAVSTGLLSGFGMELVRQGNMIGLPGVIINGNPFVIDIADPCSGLRSIFALMALSAGYGYFTQPTWVRRGLLFILAIPLAVLGNILRIMTICVVAKSFNPDFAIGFYHDFSGYIVFLVALVLLVGSGGLINLLFDRAKKDAPDKADGTPDQPAAAAPAVTVSSWIAPVAVLLCLLPVMIYQTLTPRPQVAEAPVVDLPEQLSVTLAQPFSLRLNEARRLQLCAGKEVPFVGEEVEPSEAEANLLVGATLSKRTYRLKDFPVKEFPGQENPPWFHVSSVISGVNKSSLHRPELCLPSQGFDMGARRALRVGAVDWQVITLTPKAGRGAALFAYTFVNQEGYRTDSHEARIWRDVWDRSVYNRVDRWVMVTVQLYLPDENLLTAILKSLEGVVK